MSYEAVHTLDENVISEHAELTLEGIKADTTLDLRGISCPLPPLKIMQALKRMKPVQVLEVLGTSPVGKRSAPWLARKLGNELLAMIEDEGDSYRFFIRKS